VFTLLVASSEQAMETAQQVREDLAAVGVGVDIEPVSRARDARDAFMTGEADAAIFRVSLGLLAGQYRDDSSVGFDDAGFVGHWEKANAAFDPDERRRHLEAAMSRFRELLPVTVLLPDVQFSVAHRRVRGLRSPDRGDVVEFLSELWIEKAEGRRSIFDGRDST
jgi:ABC-type transport system substrate-binding protein